MHTSSLSFLLFRLGETPFSAIPFYIIITILITVELNFLLGYVQSFESFSEYLKIKFPAAPLNLPYIYIYIYQSEGVVPGMGCEIPVRGWW